MKIWIVRAVAWYPRKSWDDEVVDRPKRPLVNIPNRWKSSGFGNMEVPVEAETKERAEEIVKNNDRVEKLRDEPTTIMKTLK